MLVGALCCGDVSQRLVRVHAADATPDGKERCTLSRGAGPRAKENREGLHCCPIYLESPSLCSLVPWEVPLMHF